MLAHLQGSHRAIFVITPISAVVTGQSPIHGSYAVFSFGLAAFIGASLWITTRYGRGHFHALNSEVFTMAASLPMLAGLRGLLRVERVLGEHRMLAVWAAAFLGLNLAVLLTFLIGIERYERRAPAPAYAGVPADGLYGYVRAHSSVSPWSGAAGALATGAPRDGFAVGGAGSAAGATGPVLARRLGGRPRAGACGSVR